MSIPAPQNDSEDADADLRALVYDRLRLLARHMLSREKPDQTLQATALVHEAYLRLSSEDPSRWNDRKHFYLVASQAMRRILIDRARQGVRGRRIQYDVTMAANSAEIVDENVDLVDLDRVLRRFSDEDPRAARLVTLRFFAGLTLEEAAETLGMSRSTAKRDWAYAKAWLRSALTIQNDANEMSDSE